MRARRASRGTGRIHRRITAGERRWARPPSDHGGDPEVPLLPLHDGSSRCHEQEEILRKITCSSWFILLVNLGAAPLFYVQS